ncbi:ENTPD4 [Lepeophtheirus salmonis]|uniref:ENTPD4 n=1 Tax=Lepeophtheirus salmonis TaxID=72036 RepID=A0A7R8D898_LEPSM|nr:ENTPD4 [Lepeophtheirus salmonis]CAF3006779.1 ENTPD4 [Lepeophtheirus salmonis]
MSKSKGSLKASIMNWSVLCCKERYSLWQISLLFFATLLLAFIFFFTFVADNSSIISYSDEEFADLDKNSNYAVVIDAGSSGSRVYLYVWPSHSGNPHELLKISPLRNFENQPYVKKITPGLSSLSETPERSYIYIKPLLDFAQEHIPSSKHKETPLFILATAGMRLLGRDKQLNIMKHLGITVNENSNFIFPENNLEIITGKQEGIYQWLAINYVLGKFTNHYTAYENGRPLLHKRPTTVGVMDMGGASMQIALEVADSVKNYPHVVEINLGGSSWFHKNFNNSTGNSTIKGIDSTSKLENPCYPNGLEYESSLKIDIDKLTNELEIGIKCDTVCPDDGIQLPSFKFERTKFYGMSEFWYSMNDVFQMGGHYNYNKFADASKAFCNESWKKTLEVHSSEHLEDMRMETQCFKSAWICAVLHEGYKFPKSYTKLTSSPSTINGEVVHWTLGAILYRTRYFPLRAIEMQMKNKSRRYSHHPTLSILSSQYMVLLCFAFGDSCDMCIST